jgi:hypothetical protein
MTGIMACVGRGKMSPAVKLEVRDIAVQVRAE